MRFFPEFKFLKRPGNLESKNKDIFINELTHYYIHANTFKMIITEAEKNETLWLEQSLNNKFFNIFSSQHAACLQ